MREWIRSGDLDPPQDPAVWTSDWARIDAADPQPFSGCELGGAGPVVGALGLIGFMSAVSGLLGFARARASR
jgi:hypothetical protein